MKVLVTSDIHIDHWREPEMVLEAIDNVSMEVDLTIVAGDTSDGDISIPIHVNSPVLVVAGNHDYHGHEMDSPDVSENLAMIYGSDAVVLDSVNPTVDIEEYRFIGVTLWTDLSLSPFDHANTVQWLRNSKFGDFLFVKGDGGGLLNEMDFIRTNSKHRAIIEDEIMRCLQEDDKTPFVITHHAPVPYSGDDGSSPYDAVYKNTIYDIMGLASWWLHGHVHSPRITNVGGTIVLERSLRCDNDEIENPSLSDLENRLRRGIIYL